MTTHRPGAIPVADGVKAANDALNGGVYSKPDMVNHPAHYTAGKVECIEAIRAALGFDGFVAYLRGQIMKYTWRLGLKDAAEQEAGKLAWYADRLRETLANGA